MNYTDIKQQSLDNYNAMNKEREKIINSPEYEECSFSAPFDFLKTLYLYDRLTLINENTSYHYKFETVSEAILTCHDIKNFDEFKTKILNAATLFEQKGILDKKINSYVNMSNYLDDRYLVEVSKADDSLYKLAVKVLNKLPEFEKLITPQLYSRIQRDILLSFNNPKQLNALKDKGIITKADMPVLFNMSNDKTYLENIEYFNTAFGISSNILKTMKFALAGVTFDGINGNRQALIDKMSKLDNKDIDLIVERYDYVDELGNKEPAYRILWNNKDIGNIPRDKALKLAEEYKDNLLSATVKKIKGGQDVSYGVDITLNIHEPIVAEKTKEKGDEEPVK